MSYKKHIAIVTTGGTIAAHHAQQTAMADYSIEQGANELVAAVPALHDIAHISTYEICNIDSRNMLFRLQHQLIRTVQELLDRPDVDGVVITHGTDTLEESALLLHWCIKSTKPVVMTGAMRPASALSADGPLNLYQAVLVATDPQAHQLGTLLVMDDHIHSARFVQKMHTTATDAFCSPTTGAIGHINNGMVYINSRPTPFFGEQCQLQLPRQARLAPVDLFFDHVDANPALFNASVNSGRKAIIIAALGHGSLSPAARAGADYAAAAGVICIRASRIPIGAVSPSEQDLHHHTLAAYHFHATAARTLAALALAQETPCNKDQLQAFLRDY